MKKIMLIVLLLLVGCSNNSEIDYKSIGNEMDNMRIHMESFAVGGGDYEQLEADIKVFNDILNKIEPDDKEVKKFIEYQIKANELRLKGIKNMDPETITESAKYQAFAENIYYELEGSK